MAEQGHSPLEHVVDHDFLEIPWIRESTIRAAEL